MSGGVSAFDGTGDTAIASGLLTIRHAQAALAVDDAPFVAEWCPIVGSCERAIHDAATGETRRETFDGEPPCSLEGVLDGRVVSTTSACDAGVDDGVIAVRDLDGDAVDDALRGLGECAPRGRHRAGHRRCSCTTQGTQTVVWAVGLDGSGMREVATFDHEPDLGPVGVADPAAEWRLGAPRRPNW